MPRPRILALPVSALLAAACVPGERQADPGPRSGRDCFNVTLVTGYEAVDDNTVKLQVGVGEQYEIDLRGGQCNNVDWTQKLAIESTPSSWICTGRDPAQGNIHFRDPTTSRRVQCVIEEVRRAPKSDPPSP